MKIVVTEKTECPHCGEGRAHLDAEGSRIVKEWLRGKGIDPKEAITGARLSSRALSFVHGGNYAVFDQDLLGGKGDGVREKEFERETGHWFTWADATPAWVACRTCRKYL